jgi:hypothetical protein
VPEEMSLYAAQLGAGAGRQLGLLLEGMMTAQVTSVLARLGVPDQLAAGPLTAAAGVPANLTLPGTDLWRPGRSGQPGDQAGAVSPDRRASGR